jgi:hypothetical protein
MLCSARGTQRRYATVEGNFLLSAVFPLQLIHSPSLMRAQLLLPYRTSPIGLVLALTLPILAVFGSFLSGFGGS